MISFRRGKTKICVALEECLATLKDATPLYVEGVHMLDGLVDDKVDRYLDDHSKVIPLFDINIVEVVNPDVFESAE